MNWVGFADKLVVRVSLLLILLISSCAFIPGNIQREDRSPASIALKAGKCKKAITRFFHSQTNGKVKKAIIALQDGKDLNEGQRQALLKRTYMIPFEEDKRSLETALRGNNKLTNSHYLTIRNFIGRDILLGHNVPKKLYKKRYFGRDENLPLSFGLEFELLIDEVPGILNHYRVGTLTEQEWYSLGIEQRLKLAKEAYKNANDVENILVRLKDANPKLPKGLFPEPHGTIEGNGLIYDNLGELRELVIFMTEHFGKFSWQPHVVMDTGAELRGMAGYSLFEFERNQLTVLENGFQRYLNNSNAIPSANLVHYSLGPIDEVIAGRIREADEFLDNGLMDITIDSVKMVNGPHFRVGSVYGEGRMGFEMRHYHKRYQEMLDGVERLTNELEEFGGLSNYTEFAKAEQVSKNTIKQALERFNFSPDEADDMELFFISLGDEILKLNKARGGGLSGADYAHRLLYPLKDWLNHPIRKHMSKDELLAMDNAMKFEQFKFIKEIKKLMDKYDVIEVTPEALDEVRVLIAQWAHRVNISEYFDRFALKFERKRRDVRYTKLPDLGFFKKLDNGVYKFNRSSKMAYDNYLENTIEIAYRDVGKTGHMELRVGKRHYSINGVLFNSSLVSKSNFSGFGSGAVGRVYRLDRNQIKEAMEQIEAFVKSIDKYNFPPFDVYGSLEKVTAFEKGFKMLGGSKNKGLIKARIEEINGRPYFVNDLIKIPAVEKDGEYYIQTTNCTRGITDILRTYIDFDIGSYPSAGMLNDAFTNGSVKKPYDVEVHY